PTCSPTPRCSTGYARSWRARTRVAGRDDVGGAVGGGALAGGGRRFLIPHSTVGDRFIPLGWRRLLSAGRSGAWRGSSTSPCPRRSARCKDQDPEVAG